MIFFISLITTIIFIKNEYIFYFKIKMLSITNSDTDTKFKLNKHYKSLNHSLRELFDEGDIKIKNYSDEDIKKVLNEIKNISNNLSDEQNILYQTLTDYKSEYSNLVKKYSDQTEFKMKYKNYIHEDYITTEKYIKDSQRNTVIEWIIEICTDIKLDNFIITNSIILFDVLLNQILVEKEQFQLLASICIYFSHLMILSEISSFDIISDISTEDNEKIIYEMIYYILNNFQVYIFDNILNYEINYDSDKLLKIYLNKNYLRYDPIELNIEIIDNLINFNSLSFEKIIPIKFKTIKEEKYELGELISSGGYGDIFKTNNNKVVVKVFQNDEFSNFFDEFMFSTLLKHPNIASIIGFNTNSLILDYYPYTLTNHILNNNLDIKQQNKLFFQIITGVSYLHSLNIIHKDLKDNNIMLDNNLNVKIIDFGFSKIINDYTTITRSSAFNSPPEFLLGDFPKKINSLNSDIWSLGFILIFIHTKLNHLIIIHKLLEKKRKIFKEIEIQDYRDFLSEGNTINIKFSDNDFYNNLIDSIFEIDPKKRPTIKKLFRIFSSL